MPSHVPKEVLEEYAARHRACPTVAEARLLSAHHYATKRLLDHNLRRWKLLDQVPMPPYIVDFACIERRLIIEVDGPYHMTPQQKDYDTKRTAYLMAAGYRVLRFNNDAILSCPQFVLRRIKHYLLDMTDNP